MPSERAARDDFLAAAEHIRKLMSITDEIDELIPCDWLSTEEAELIRPIPEFPFRCVLDEHLLIRTLRDTVDLQLAIIHDDRVAAVGSRQAGDQGGIGAGRIGQREGGSGRVGAVQHPAGGALVGGARGAVHRTRRR